MSDEIQTENSIEKLSIDSSSENLNSFEYIPNGDSIDSQFNHHDQSIDQHQNTTEFNDESTNQDQSYLSNDQQQQPVTNETSPEINEKQDEEEEELKPQREIDEDDIPPPELPVDENPSVELPVDDIPPVESPVEENPSVDSTPNSEVIINDERPLTSLEDPFGLEQQQQQKEEEEQEEEQSSSLENSPEQLNDTSHLTNEITEDYPLENPTLSSFLPDIVNQTIEDNTNIQTNNQDDIINDRNPSEFTDEDFPPLPNPEGQFHSIVSEQDFPPLPTPIHQEILIPTTTTTTTNSTDIQPPVDVLANRTLFKQILVEGEANTRPTRSTMVTISYNLSLVDSLTSNTRLIEEIKHEKYFISENDLIPAIDICVQLMNRGEICLIESDVRHVYGEQGCEEKHLPPITTLNPYKMKIQLELHDWSSPLDIQLLPIEERLFWSEKKKLNGNFFYRRQDYKTSLQCYHGASRFLDLNLNPLKYSTDQNQKLILIEKYIQVQNNIAQVYLLLNKYDQCLQAVENVLTFDSKNVKALFRQGKALIELGKYQEAIQPLKLFLLIQKGNSNANIDIEKANELIHLAENKLANYQKNEREIYQRMFRPNNNNNNNQQQNKTNNPKQIIQSNQTNWVPYIAIGAAACAVIGYVAFKKYR